MEPVAYYNNRLTVLDDELQKWKRRKSSFAWLRLGPVIAIIAAFYFLWTFGFMYVAVASVAMLFIFVRLINADLKNQDRIERCIRLIKINKDELQALSGDFFIFEDGAQHIVANHPYANDLDLFGRASLFQYINRTTSEAGSKKLAEFLLSPAAAGEIIPRQKAISELVKKITWIQELRSAGKKNVITFSSAKRLEDWIKDPLIFSSFKPWRWLRYVLPAIIIAVVFLYIFNAVGNPVFYATLLIFAVIAYQINKYVAPVHAQLSKIADELGTLSASISLIEKQDFACAMLQQMKDTFTVGNKRCSDEIFKLKKILGKLDLRYNMVLSAPLNLLLLWNLQQMLDLEKWKASKNKELHTWFDMLATFEAINTFAILHFNHPHWCFPVINDSYFSIEGAEVGHPLIPNPKRVNNFISIKSNEELMLVTGSNMAGKSTYLRSIGVNVILAMAGAPVCASTFAVSHVHLMTSMRIADNLEESTSTFYAELKNLKSIIVQVNAGSHIFILLDEILRGTNSLDRHTGSKALIKQFIARRAPSIIATHDLELAGLAEDFPGKILNYHFDVQVSGEELYFDYKLKPGICNSLNASILMKKIGIEL